MAFHENVSDNKSPQVSETLLSILDDLNNAVVWMVSTCSVISKTSSSCINHLVAAPQAPITIGIIVTFILRMFFLIPDEVQVLISLFASCYFYFEVSQDSKVHCSANSVLFFYLFFFLWIIIMSSRLAEVSWSVCMSKSQRSLSVPFSYIYSGLCIYRSFVESNLNIL